MLVLTRKAGETVVVGSGPDAIVFTVIRVDGPNKVKVGVHAPRGVHTLRGELIESDSKNGGRRDDGS